MLFIFNNIRPRLLNSEFNYRVVAHLGSWKLANKFRSYSLATVLVCSCARVVGRSWARLFVCSCARVFCGLFLFVFSFP